MVAVSSLRVAVVGASLGGLSVANVLHRLGFKVQVYEAFAAGFHTRGGALGAVDVELLQRIRADTGEPRHIRGHGHFYGDLWEYLYDGLPEGTVTFGVDVMSIENAESDEPQLSVLGITRSFDLIIGCDGGKSTIRQYVTSQLPVYAGYTVWRGLCPRAGVAGPPSGSARVGGFQFETLGFPCAGPESVGELWNCGIYMAMPEHLVSAPTRNRQVGSAMKTVPAWFIPLVRQLFGDRNARFWEKCAESGKVSPHPVWELAADRVVNRRVALLGDAAHMSSPRTGAGAYTAMVDAVVMGAAIEQAGGNIDEALRFYNDDTVRRGKDLYKRSRAAGSHFAPPGLTAVPPESLLA